MKRALLLAAALAAPARAQDHAGHMMPGMTMPMPAARPKPRPKPAPRRPAQPATRAPVAPPIDHRAMSHAMPVPADTGAAAPAPAIREGTDLPAGTGPAPVPPLPHHADRIWDPAAMARGRAIMMDEEGGGRSFAQVRVDLAEAQLRGGQDGYRWDGEGWFGGDVHRLVVRSEGEGRRRGGVEAAEVQALYSRAIGPYFNLQAGVRQDIRPTPARSYASLGVEGLAPYWFDVEATAFLSTHGELLGRVEAYYDQRLTQRLILQPRVELNLSAQRVRELALGSGVAQAELGLRLRYEIAREFAPYAGVSWERRLGATGRLARAAGEGRGGAALVLGIRGWF